MGRFVGVLTAIVGITAVAGCDDTILVVDDDDPAAPRGLAAHYFEHAIFVTWELPPQWDGESFRIYARRTSDPDFFLIAEVTNCIQGLCSYADVNIVEGVTYRYFVTAVDPDNGRETESAFSVEVEVPSFAPPPVPTGTRIVALDGVVYLAWGSNARSADDFSFYRVYLEDGEGALFLLGETDSEGFLDERVENGSTYRYRVTSVDLWGHESGTSAAAEGTPRPDFHAEVLFSIGDLPAASGFRFRSSGSTDPVVHGAAPERHFHLEEAGGVWTLVPGPDAVGVTQGTFTTALRCGVGADPECVDLPVAPASGYTTLPVQLFPETTYVLQVRGDDGLVHFGALRVALLGFDEFGAALAVFDWSYQLQPGNPALLTTGGDQP